MRIHFNFVVMLVGACFLSFGNIGQAGAQETTEFETMPIAAAFAQPSADGVDLENKQEKARYNDKVNSANKFRRDRQDAVSDLLRNKGSDITQAQVSEWIDGYVIPSMAQSDEMSLSKLGENRKNFFRVYIRNVANNGLKNRILDQIRPKMKTIVEGNYHPACRVNALVLLSELNRSEGNRSSQRLPVPEPEMLTYMLNVIKSQTLQTRYLVPAALAGIERHAAARRPGTNNALTDAEATQIGDAMLGILATDPEAAPDGVDPDVIRWNQRRAVRILGVAGNVGNNNQYAKALRDTFSDDKADPKMRIDAIAAYGLLDFKNDREAADVKAVALKIAELIAMFADQEAKYIEDKIGEIKFTVQFLDGGSAESSKRKRAKPGGPSKGVDADSGGGGRSGSSARDKNAIKEVLPYYHRDLVKRRFKTRAWIGRSTLVGINKGRIQQKGLRDLLQQDDPEREIIKEIIDEIDKMMRETDVFEPEEDEDDEDAEDQPIRTESYADELKNALARGSKALSETVAKHQPKEGGEADAGDTSGGQ